MRTPRQAAAAARPLDSADPPPDGRPALRSALRVAGQPRPPSRRDGPGDGGLVLAPVPQPSARQSMADEYLLWLGSRTNKHGVPYAKGTLGAYRDGVIALDTCMTREAVDGDFTMCDTGMLNRFFADYLREHTATPLTLRALRQRDHGK